MNEMTLKITDEEFEIIKNFARMSGQSHDAVIAKIFSDGIEKLKLNYYFELKDFAEEEQKRREEEKIIDEEFEMKL